MPENMLYLPEGLRSLSSLSLSELQNATANHTILEGVVQRCDTERTLHIPLGSIDGQIPVSQAVAPWISGASRDIAVISRVGKQTCFTVSSINADSKGAPVAILSRRDAQEIAMEHFLEHLYPGCVLICRVTHLDSFGAFLDIGCGIIAMLPIERISISRLNHPRDRLRVGQKIRAAVYSIDPERRRITMTLRELLGNWMENASRFSPGETVRGIVRSVKDYGTFIELTPNLSGLADTRDGIQSGDSVSVYIKSIRPERMKIKLQIIDTLPRTAPQPLQYQITDGPLTHWVYSPPNYQRPTIETVFTEADP